MGNKPPHYWITCIAIAACYFVFGKLGLQLASVHPSATAVWPPTGIAFAAVLILGYRFWPGIFLGAFLVNWTTAGSMATSLGIATGNTLEALVGAYFVNRFAGGRNVFDSSADVFRFVLLAGMLSTTISATVGVSSLAVGGFAARTALARIWLTWWTGDAMGHLLVSPLLVLFSNKPVLRWRKPQYIEAGALAAGVILIGSHVFMVPFDQTRDFFLPRACMPMLAWTAFRFGRRETAILTAIFSGIALWGTLHGLGPFAVKDQ
ncbi:MAG: MASE1 domain-containing protein, partial [Proteobacteria bacterium]|nr:MASE1 domain-containing protein [Pseudomonadota bacterium]